MKSLILDVETSPSKAYIWSLWQEVNNYSFVYDDWYLLCWAAKWLGEKKVFHSSLPDFDLYKKDPYNDKLVLKELWKLLDEADVLIGHNMSKFDRRKINARFIFHGIKPPSPYKIIDTLLIAKKEFAFTSNRLNDIGKFLGLGKKLETGGFELWRRCIEGDLKAWKKMVKYNIGDIKLGEKVYMALRPYIVQHPNCGIYIKDEKECCPKCGSQNIHHRGYTYTNVSKFHRFVCKDCGGWGRKRLNCLTKDKRLLLTTNIS